MSPDLKEFLWMVWDDRWDVFLIIGLAIFRKDVWKAIKGGNGVLQMNEVAKALILLVFYLSFRKESSRVDLAHPVFMEAYWFAILGSVALIAGIDAYRAFNKKSEETTP